MSMDRMQRITEARLRQPLSELERKAAKAWRAQNIWTVEEIDAARVKGREISRRLKFA